MSGVKKIATFYKGEATKFMTYTKEQAQDMAESIEFSHTKRKYGCKVMDLDFNNVDGYSFYLGLYNSNDKFIGYVM